MPRQRSISSPTRRICRLIQGYDEAVLIDVGTAFVVSSLWCVLSFLQCSHLSLRHARAALVPAALAEKSSAMPSPPAPAPLFCHGPEEQSEQKSFSGLMARRNSLHIIPTWSGGAKIRAGDCKGRSDLEQRRSLSSRCEMGARPLQAPAPSRQQSHEALALSLCLNNLIQPTFGND